VSGAGGDGPATRTTGEHEGVAVGGEGQEAGVRAVVAESAAAEQEHGEEREAVGGARGMSQRTGWIGSGTRVRRVTWRDERSRGRDGQRDHGISKMTWSD